MTIGVLCGSIAICLGITIIVLWMTGMCQDEVTAQIPNQTCNNAPNCIEYVSAYMVLCKYSNQEMQWTVWLLYYIVLTVIIILDGFVCTAAKNGVIGPGSRLLTHLLTVTAALGISLIISFDHKDVEGTYTHNSETLVITGYDQSPGALHGLGVLLLFLSGALTHIILLVQYSIIQGNCAVEKNDDRCNMMVDIALQLGGEVVYIVTMTIFLLCFALNAVTTAIALEYLTLSFYISLFIIAIGTRVDISNKLVVH